MVCYAKYCGLVVLFCLLLCFLLGGGGTSDCGLSED